MALSAAKTAKLEIKRRSDTLRARSLNPEVPDAFGYWMDHGHEMTARKYLETGDEALLSLLPDYRMIRAANKR
jgi:hypothetical protein